MIKQLLILTFLFLAGSVQANELPATNKWLGLHLISKSEGGYIHLKKSSLKQNKNINKCVFCEAMPILEEKIDTELNSPAYRLFCNKCQKLTTAHYRSLLDAFTEWQGVTKKWRKWLND